MNPNFENIYQMGLRSIEENKFEHYKCTLNSSILEISRIKTHLEVKSLMNQGQFLKALNLIKTQPGISKENIGFFADHVCLYYLNHQYSVWSEQVPILENLFHLNEAFLSPEVKSKVLLLLSKFYEEMGAIHKSLELLSAAKNSSDTEFSLRVLANQIRIESTYFETFKFRNKYFKLNHLQTNDFGLNTSPELLHALLLAEFSLFSVDFLAEKLFEWIQKFSILEDKSLIYFDVILILLRRDLNPPDLLLTEFQNIQPTTPFENRLMDYLHQKPEWSQGWDSWLNKMPLGNFLQLAPMLLKTIPPIGKRFLKEKIPFLIQGLSQADQRFWNQRLIQSSSRELSSISENTHGPLQLDAAKNTLQLGQVHIHLGRQKVLTQLIQILQVRKEISLDDLSKELYQVSEFNESYYHRIRRLTQRINSEFERKLLPPLLKYNRESLCLCKSYQ